MAGPGASRKRAHANNASRPHKKPRFTRQKAYHSSSEEESNDEGFAAVDLAESDDEDVNMKSQDAPAAEPANEPESSSDQDDDEDDEVADNDEFDEEALAAEDDDEGEDDEEEDDEEDDDEDDITGLEGPAAAKKSKSKRNDPTAFATSLSKILSTKLSTSKRADPMLSRSIDALQASQAIVDSALEAKAKKHLKEEKRSAYEKGRVKDVLEPKIEGMPQVQLSASKSMAEERKLRKVAQKGVIKLFNAVRAAQVKAAEAQKEVRKEGMLGIAKREAKVQEMTKKGFLDLIASGGGGLKKGPILEA
ncbi:hypothetical protein TD95_005061 [Thielaviopsis punctulata]|uniref:Rrp15p-domain-containing protein n=1 Tax=Thielaviopsis punctulata TaxID=72032 RepID=A0A0F4ZJX2_9PEZI|nr:hypothetical protein TD95_005061 [Thielaviopsis punctulata]